MKPLKEITFRPIQGIWRDILGDSGTLADTLKRYDLIIDDKCVFARLKDYDKNLCYYYRADAGKITITIWEINTL